MDIKPPPKRRSNPAVETRPVPVEKPVPLDTLSAQGLTAGLSIDEDKTADNFQLEPKRLSTAKRISIAVVAAIILTVAAAIGWYAWAIAPVSTDQARQKFVVASGETPSVIAHNLQQAHLIKNSFALELYAKAHGSADSLRAGTYKLSPSQSVASIVSELVKGQSATYNVLIPPGLTLKQLADPAVKGSFAAQGFSVEEIQAAFSATYVSPLLKDKPAGVTLEGYIYPETFNVKEGDSLQSVLERSFDTLYDRLSADGLLQKFTTQGLTLHQALTLGSIVQEESSGATTQKQIAQVFLKRMSVGMTLGSDVTFIYAAHQLGVTPTPELDSPYNTRIHTGLPPGPIATMNYSALLAVANPAEGDYLFFVAGDDGVVHFSRTNAEHDQQVQQYCQKLCSAVIQ